MRRAVGDSRGKLPLKPADFTDAKMVGEMAGNYWMWHVVAIAYVHPPAGLAGPHTPSDYLGMGSGHAGH